MTITPIQWLAVLKAAILLTVFGSQLPFMAWGQSFESPQNTGQIDLFVPTTKSQVNLAKRIAIKAVQADFKGFCEWNRMDRATGWAFGDDLEAYRRLKTAGDRDGAAELMHARVARRSIKDPWTFSILGHPLLKSETPTGFVVLCKNKSGALDCATSIRENLARTDLHFDYSIPDYRKYTSFEMSATRLFGACAYLTRLYPFECKKAARELIPLLEPAILNASDVTGISLVSDALSNRRITNALQRAAVSLWDRIEKRKFDTSDDVFHDLVREFSREGLNKTDSEREALTVLGAISAGGPNFTSRIAEASVTYFPVSCVDYICNLNGVFMAAIAEGMAIADTIKMSSANPNLYSLPKEVHFACDAGKSYHFWASAAWTAHLMRAGYSRTASRAAVFASHLGYQTSREVGNSRMPSDPLSYPRFGSIENGIRIDIGLSSAGTAFAADIIQNKSPNIDLEQGFIHMIEKGKSTPPDPFRSSFEMGVWDLYEYSSRLAARTALHEY